MNNSVPIDIEKVVPRSGRSFLAIHYRNPYFAAPLHRHQEYELILIERGNGLSLVGDGVRKLSPGDVMLIGQNLPHLWLSADEYYVPDTTLISESVYAQFGSHIFPSDTENIPEMSKINLLLKESERGLCFSGDRNLESVMKKFRNLLTKEGVGRLLSLYEILNQLAADCSYTQVASGKYQNKSEGERENDTLQRILNYVNNHYQDQLTLNNIAQQVQLNATALCRHFKHATGKTLFDYIREQRINYATKLLVNSNMPAKRIAYDCGYNNVSFFNKQFREVKNTTPCQYRKLYRKEYANEEYRLGF